MFISKDKILIYMLEIKSMFTLTGTFVIHNP